MFDVSFPELILIAIVALLVIGPERLPETLRTIGLWIGRLRRSFTSVKAEIEREIGMDDIRRQLHNEAVMDELKRIEREVRDSVNATVQRPDEGRKPGEGPPPPENRIEPPPAESLGVDGAQAPAAADAPTGPNAPTGADTPSDQQRRNG